MSEWIAYGDADPLRHGGIWLRQDEDYDRAFQIVVLTVFGDEDEETYNVNDGLIDLTDSWIDWRSVIDYALPANRDEDEHRALAALNYYGLIEFGGSYGNAFVDTDEAIRQLKVFGIDV